MENHVTLNLISRSSVRVTHMGVGGMNYMYLVHTEDISLNELTD